MLQVVLIAWLLEPARVTRVDAADWVATLRAHALQEDLRLALADDAR